MDQQTQENNATETWVTLDANEAASNVAYRLSEVIAIYPITPSTPMGEFADSWAATGRANLWGSQPQVIEMQSEAGAAGAVHGALQAGALTTTFTASQGLLLMIPNMYKIAGELTSAVFHVAARAIATQGLSIFGDHADVMACRATGFAMLASRNVQEAQDLAAVAHASTLAARVPFIHFFDGFRTSHEINKIIPLDDQQLAEFINNDLVHEHRARALSPNNPFIRGTAQNPDVYFQSRETVNPYYAACPGIVSEAMNRFAAITGRQYKLYEYDGAEDAERVIVIMGSGAETAAETARFLAERGEKVGVLNVRLFRPFAMQEFTKVLPATVRSIAVLDRTKEPGSAAEPLFLDVVAALNEGRSPDSRLADNICVIGGRYGLGSKEFTPAMVKGVFDELAKDEPKRRFTVGIIDDVGQTSIDFDPSFMIEEDQTVRCLFYGLGSDGTVGANKNAIKIIGEETNLHAQGYFVYDSKKSGSMTVSHLRFGPHQIRAPYLIEQAGFIACSQFSFLERVDVLRYAKAGGVFLLNTSFDKDTIWAKLPRTIRKEMLEKNIQFYIIDADRVAQESGMGRRVNTVMQACFFAISGVLPYEQAVYEIKKSIRKTYGKRGETVVRQNERAVDQAISHMSLVDLTGYSVDVDGVGDLRLPVPIEAPDFVRNVLGSMISGNGDMLPVGALPADGTYPSGTARWEKRNLALEIPVWEQDLCIQCGKCSFVCPHAVIRSKVYEPEALDGAPAGFKSVAARFKELPNMRYTLQVSPEDCTGCALCVEICPVKDKSHVGRKAINMAPQPPIRAQESESWDFFTKLPEMDRERLVLSSIKNSQLMIPLFEFSGACSGCGETPYIKLATQLFGDRMVVANATGCSSIYGGNLPTTPWSIGPDGRGPAWSNSLFEDNAEFGLGMRMAIDQQTEEAERLLKSLAEPVGSGLAEALLTAEQRGDAALTAQRLRVETLKRRLEELLGEKGLDAGQRAMVERLQSCADSLVNKSVWIIGGDGWAYDIGFGGLDHVMASGRNVNILVLDTEVYSNTGGQASKSTPRGAVAKFAAKGKGIGKKDLGLLAMAYGHVYVARVAMGADDVQTLRTFLEAEAYPGPSLIIAYSHCIAHGIDMRKGLDQQRLAVQSGHWPLYRFNPELADGGKNPLILDSKAPSIPLSQYIYNETRYRMLQQSDPDRAADLLHTAEHAIRAQWEHYRQLAEETVVGPD